MGGKQGGMKVMIFFSCGKMGLDAIGSRIISSTSAAHGPHDSMQVLRSHKFNTQHVPLPPNDKEEVEKLGQLLTFAVREWHRTQPENDEAASKHKALEAKVRFDSKTWPPQQVDGSSCGVLTVYNITLAAMGISIPPKLLFRVG